MVPVNLKSLVGRLNDTCRRTLEAAAGLCLSRTNYNVEIEHWLLKLLEGASTDVSAILRHYEIDSSRLQRDITKAVDRLKTGNARPPALSPNVVDLAREAWTLCSIEYGASRSRSGHLICALLSDETLARIAHDGSPEFEKISEEVLRKELNNIVANSSETDGAGASEGAAVGAGRAAAPGGSTKTVALDQFTIDLTARAKKGEIDPVLGRDAEIRQVIDILTRRRQNNPI